MRKKCRGEESGRIWGGKNRSLGETGNNLAKAFRSDHRILCREEEPGAVVTVHTGMMPTELDEVEVLREGVGCVGMLVNFHKEDAAFHAPVLDCEGLDRDMSGARGRFTVVHDGNRGRVVLIKVSGTEWGVTDL